MPTLKRKLGRYKWKCRVSLFFVLIVMILMLNKEMVVSTKYVRPESKIMWLVAKGSTKQILLLLSISRFTWMNWGLSSGLSFIGTTRLRACWFGSWFCWDPAWGPTVSAALDFALPWTGEDKGLGIVHLTGLQQILLVRFLTSPDGDFPGKGQQLVNMLGTQEWP